MSRGAKDLIACIALVAFITWLLGVFGPQIDARTADQVQASKDFDRDMRAAAYCRQLHGEASMEWSASGELVCIPRQGKKVIASNY